MVSRQNYESVKLWVGKIMSRQNGKSAKWRSAGTKYYTFSKCRSKSLSWKLICRHPNVFWLQLEQNSTNQRGEWKELEEQTMEKRALKNVNNSLNTNIYSYLETSGGQSSKMYLNAAPFLH